MSVSTRNKPKSTYFLWAENASVVRKHKSRVPVGSGSIRRVDRLTRYQNGSQLSHRQTAIHASPSLSDSSLGVNAHAAARAHGWQMSGIDALPGWVFEASWRLLLRRNRGRCCGFPERTSSLGPAVDHLAGVVRQVLWTMRGQIVRIRGAISSFMQVIELYE